MEYQQDFKMLQYLFGKLELLAAEYPTCEVLECPMDFFWKAIVCSAFPVFILHLGRPSGDVFVDFFCNFLLM